MSIWKMPVSVELMNERGRGSMVERVGIEFVEVGDDFAVAKMPVDYRTKQPLGIMHGGASCVLAETAGSTAANFCVDHATNYCVGLSINTSHIRAARTGFVYGRAEPLHLGKNTQVWRIEIRNEADKLISMNRLTMMVISRKQATE